MLAWLPCIAWRAALRSAPRHKRASCLAGLLFILALCDWGAADNVTLCWGRWMMHDMHAAGVAEVPA